MIKDIRLPISEAKYYEKKGIVGLKEILGKNGAMVIVDLDDTIKEARKFTWTDGAARRFIPDTAVAVSTVHSSGLNLGIATEQSFVEIEPFIRDLARLATDTDDPYQLFDGVVLAEGGSVARSALKGQVILAPPQARKDILKVNDWLRSHLQTSDLDDWFVLNGTDPSEATYVQLPPSDYTTIATASLWERGPHISEDPHYVSRYAKIEKVVRKALVDLGINSLSTYEAGNGTLRIVPRYVNKAHSMELLAAMGVLDLSRTVYICDGQNDIKLAQKIKSKGGGVVAVANAVTALHEIADYSATLPVGRGFAQAISLIYPDQFISEKRDFDKKGMGLK